MAIDQFDGAVAHSFGLEIDGCQLHGITEVGGLKMDIDVIELRQNTADGKYVVSQLFGRKKESNKLTFKRALTGESSFRSWARDSQLGDPKAARRNAACMVFDHSGQVIQRWILESAWVSSYTVNTLKAGDTQVMQEELQVTCNTLRLE